MAKYNFEQLFIQDENPILAKRKADGEIVDRTTINMEKTVEFAQKTTRVEKTPNVHNNMKTNMKSRLVGMETSTGHHDSHCDTKHKGKDKYREEKNIPISSSIKDARNVEGCEDHYFSRFVKIDDAPEKSQAILTKSKAAEAIVWGEILNDPLFKRRWR